MSPNVQIWLPPMLTLLGTLIAVLFAAWLSNRAMEANNRAIEGKLEANIRSIEGKMEANIRSIEGKMEANNRAIEAKIEALRAEMKQGFAELRLEFHTAFSAFEHRLERVEERLQLVQK